MVFSQKCKKTLIVCNIGRFGQTPTIIALFFSNSFIPLFWKWALLKALLCSKFEKEQFCLMSLCNIIWYFCRFFIWRYVESVEVLFFARIPHTGQGDKPRDSRLGLVIFIRSTFIVFLLRPGKVVSRLEFTTFSEVEKIWKKVLINLWRHRCSQWLMRYIIRQEILFINR